MKKINFKEVEKYVEENISSFHRRRLEFVETKVEFGKILEQKNPYLFKAKNILTAQELVKGFLDAFLQSQEEGLFGYFLEGLAIFVADKVYSAKKTDLVGMDLEFIKDGVIYVVEIKGGWNWGNDSQIKQLKINAKNAKAQREEETGKAVKILNGCCFGKKKNRNPERDGYQKICGQEFWHLISNEEDFYVKIVEPIGFRAKERNEEFQEAYAILINKFTLEFAVKFCDDGKINWEKLLQFNSGKKNKKR
jgi:hypothetical protein